MNKLLYTPKIWMAEQTTRGVYPLFRPQDSIRFDVDITGNQDVVIIENPSSFIKYLDAVGVNSTTVELKLKKPLSQEFITSGFFTSLLKSAGVNYEPQLNLFILADNPAPLYLTLLLNIDDIIFTVKDGRVKELTITQEKGKLPYLEAIVTGWVELTGSPPMYSPLNESNYVTSLYIQGVLNYWNSLELSIKNDVYEQVDLQTGKKYFELVKNETELNIDFDAGVLAPWGELMGAGVTFNDLTIKAVNVQDFSIMINGVLKEPAVPKDRRGVSSQDIKIIVKRLAFEVELR